MKREASKPVKGAAWVESASWFSNVANLAARFQRRRFQLRLPGDLRLSAAWPVMVRELRGEARNPFNYLLRVAAGAVVMAVFAVMMGDQSGNAAQLGARLFDQLNQSVFVAIVVCVPMLTADCISREKREGTLGLLFLTPLEPNDIVVGKSLIHSVRAFTLLLAVLPVLLLPFLLGGVSTQTVIGAITLNLSGVFLGLSAGLLASMRNVEWIRAIVFAEILSIGFVFVLQILPVSRSAVLAMRGSGSIGLAWIYQSIAVAAIFLVSIRYCGANLNRIWQQETVAPPQPRWVKLFSNSEFWRSIFHWNTRRTLDRNPIAWLQEYSWTARLTKWGWCIVIFFSECMLLFADGAFRFSQWQTRLGFALTFGVAFSAAGSFRRERQSGALELLLVTPLKPWQIIGGRIWGVWCHFFPAFAILLFIWVFNPVHLSWHDRGLTWFFFDGFLTLPAVGMCLSLSRLHFLVGWLATSVIGIWFPYLAGMSVEVYTSRHYGMRMVPYEIMGFIQACLGAGAWFLLVRNLKWRIFALERPAT